MISKTGKTGMLPEVAYPAPPWQLGGDSWLGAFKSRIPVRAPVPLRPVLNERYLVIAVIRYLYGTLSYDELIIGSLARYGWRIGLYVHYIWVDDMSSLWGGRRIWGLNKEMAEFSWQGSTVEITDEQGLIANITVEREEKSFPTIWLPVPSFGQLDDQWVFTRGSIRTRLAHSKVHINQWSSRFPYQISGTSIYSIGGNFDLTFVKPNKLT